MTVLESTTRGRRATVQNASSIPAKQVCCADAWELEPRAEDSWSKEPARHFAASRHLPSQCSGKSGAVSPFLARSIKLERALAYPRLPAGHSWTLNNSVVEQDPNAGHLLDIAYTS